jgi:hypothetical protein
VGELVGRISQVAAGESHWVEHQPSQLPGRQGIEASRMPQWAGFHRLRQGRAIGLNTNPVNCQAGKELRQAECLEA